MANGRTKDFAVIFVAISVCYIRPDAWNRVGLCAWTFSQTAETHNFADRT